MKLGELSIQMATLNCMLKCGLHFSNFYDTQTTGNNIGDVNPKHVASTYAYVRRKVTWNRLFHRRDHTGYFIPALGHRHNEQTMFIPYLLKKIPMSVKYTIYVSSISRIIDRGSSWPAQTSGLILFGSITNKTDVQCPQKRHTISFQDDFSCLASTGKFSSRVCRHTSLSVPFIIFRYLLISNLTPHSVLVSKECKHIIRIFFLECRSYVYERGRNIGNYDQMLVIPIEQ